MKLHHEMIERRRIILTQDITPEVVEDMVSIIEALALRSSDPVELYINSSGGSTEASLRLFDVIKNAKELEFRGRVIGKCMSAAVIILQACKIREALENASFKVHEPGQDYRVRITPSTNLAAEFEKQKQIQVATIKMNEHSKKYICAHLHPSRKLFNGCYRKGSYFGSHEALKMGLIDRVI